MLRRRFLSLMTGAAGALAAPSVLRAQSRTPVTLASGVTPPSLHNIFLHVAHERGFFRVDAWADFRFQDRAIAELGRFALVL